MTQNESRIIEFKETTVSSLLSPKDFVDWRHVDNELQSRIHSIRALQDYVESGNFDQKSLEDFLSNHPDSYILILSLIAFNASGSQIEKWGLPERVPKEPDKIARLASNLGVIGFEKAFVDGASVEAQVRIAEVYKDSFKRRFRSGNKLEDSVSRIIDSAVTQASERSSSSLKRVASNVMRNSTVSRFLDYVILQDDRPIAGVVTVFQQQSGGRQARELSYTYPTLQENLRELGMSLILIADGPGIQDASMRALNALFDGVRFPMTMEQASRGDLVDAIIETTIRPEVAPLENAAIDSIIESTLISAGSVDATDLPLRPREASLALARFRESKRELSIEMSPNGNELKWQTPDLVTKALALRHNFSPERAVDLLTALIEVEKHYQSNESGNWDVVLSIDKVAPFPDYLFVRAVDAPYDNTLAQSTSSKSMEMAHDARFCVLILPEGLQSSTMSDHRRLQSLRAVSVIVLSPEILERASKSTAPRAIIVDELMRQADLSKVSPFILSNATPSRMFFGRQREAAATLATIATNSVAILGSRRIGKTSMLRRLRDDLTDASFSPYFGDCQTVRTWQDFSKLARREWGVEVAADFSPNHLVDLVDELVKTSSGPTVIVLDEVDQLLMWDTEHSEDSVPEAFFRSCRAISQSGKAQFIFSGERAISQRIWDPQSPHWNFCRPIQLTQLPKSDASELFLSPLSGLGIELVDQSKISDLVWTYTSGHPQLVQYLGDKVLRSIDVEKHKGSLYIESEDLSKVADQFDFAEHYVSTYLGQANDLERAISYILDETPKSKDQIRQAIKIAQFNFSERELETALRMLQLYGIVSVEGGVFALRSIWLPDALKQFGAPALNNSMK